MSPQCVRFVAVTVVAVSGVVLAAAVLPVGWSASAQQAQGTEQSADAEDGAWFCPMHPEVTSATPGECNKCRMKLIRGNPFDTSEYLLDLSTQPGVTAAGMPFRLHSTIREPSLLKIQRTYELVHEKPYHLFVIGQDMESFQHLHPIQEPDGTWSLDLSVPKAGYYRVVSDFVPAGGSPQFLMRTLIVPGYGGDILSETPSLKDDIDEVKRVDHIVATVSLVPERLIAGQYGHFQFSFSDSDTGKPIRDLQPYLGAFGHMLMMHQDMLHAVHSHPTSEYDGKSVSGFGGPIVTFEGYLPIPGLYRAWTQVLRHGELTTIPYTFRVLSLEEAAGLNR